MMGLTDLNEKYDCAIKSIDGLSTKIGALHEYLQTENASSPSFRYWEYRQVTTLANLNSSGAGTFATIHSPNGWETLVERLSLSVSGASSGATAAVYVAIDGADTGEGGLADYAAVFLGNSPSRNIADFHQPIWLPPDYRLVVSIASAAASATVFARAQAKRREVQARHQEN